MPSHLPLEARELVSRMLDVDPLTRITIPEIRKMPWFLKDLPDYLSIPPNEFDVGLALRRQNDEKSKFPTNQSFADKLHEGKKNFPLNIGKSTIPRPFSSNGQSSKPISIVIKDESLIDSQLFLLLFILLAPASRRQNI